MVRRPLIAGNWKMHLTISEAAQLATAIATACTQVTDRDIMLAPAAVALSAVQTAVANTPVMVGSQNVAWEKSGAFTGEISPPMLQDIGVKMAIIGHSERRHIFAENDEMINKRVIGCLAMGLTPVFCIGETLDQREADQTFPVLEAQITAGLANLSHEEAAKVVVAYEPVWAIGTGKTASSAQAQEAHAFVRSCLERLFEKKVANAIRILYGGSVKPTNIDTLMNEADVDGALVGGASLTAESFERIIKFNL